MRPRTTPEHLLANAAEQTPQRLRSLSTLYDASTFRLLDALGIEGGWRCLEIGAGSDSVPLWLSDAVGDNGVVVATDVDTRWLEHIDRPNVVVLHHDISTSRLPHDHYDLVHARLVLSHLPDRMSILNRLVQSLRRGGWLLVEDFDDTFVAAARPEAQSRAEAHASRVRQAFRHLLSERGESVQFAHRLAGAFKERGLRQVGAEGRVVFGGDAVVGVERATISQVREELTGAGLVTDQDVDAYLESLDDIQVALPMLISTWGRRAP